MLPRVVAAAVVAAVAAVAVAAAAVTLVEAVVATQPNSPFIAKPVKS